MTDLPREFGDQIARAIGDPGSVVGRKFGPSWGEGNDGYAENEETVTRWSTRAVLEVLVASGWRPEAGLVAVDPADLRLVLDQREGHRHTRPGIWDSDNPPQRANKPCVECAARDRLRAALATALEPVGALPVAAEQLEPIKCSRCGKPVSRPMPADVVVRAWVECPECAAGTPAEGQERSEEPNHG